jgi:hypothetical protein
MQTYFSNSSDNSQRDIRNEIERKNKDFVKSHSRVIGRAKLVVRNPKKFPVKAENEIARQNKRQKPNDQNRVIYDRAPKQKSLQNFDVHNFTSLGLYCSATAVPRA